MSDDNEKIVRFASGVEQAGFTMIENALLVDGTLSLGAKVVWLLLKHYAWEDNEAFPGQARLAWQAGCTEPSLRKHIAELKARGLVQQKRRGLGRTNLYTLFRPDRTWLTDVSLQTERNRPSATKDPSGEVEAVEEDTETPSSPPSSEMPSPADGRDERQPPLGRERDLPAEVWAVYVEEMKPRKKALLPQERAVIRDALKVASAEECIEAIRGCKASAWHMGENPTGTKYNRLSQILRGKSGKRTVREHIDLLRGYLVNGSQIPSDRIGEINQAKEKVRLGLTHPTHDYHREQGEQAQEFLRQFGLEARAIEYEVKPGVMGIRVLWS